MSAASSPAIAAVELASDGRDICPHRLQLGLELVLHWTETAIPIMHFGITVNSPPDLRPAEHIDRKEAFGEMICGDPTSNSLHLRVVWRGGCDDQVLQGRLEAERIADFVFDLILSQPWFSRSLLRTCLALDTIPIWSVIWPTCDVDARLLLTGPTMHLNRVSVPFAPVDLGAKVHKEAIVLGCGDIEQARMHASGSFLSEPASRVLTLAAFSGCRKYMKDLGGLPDRGDGYAVSQALAGSTCQSAPSPAIGQN